MRNDVDAAAIRSLRNVLAELEGAFFDAGRGRDRGGDDFDAVGLHGLHNVAPVLDAGDEVAGYLEGVEAQKAMGENYRVLRRGCELCPSALCYIHAIEGGGANHKSP